MDTVSVARPTAPKGCSTKPAGASPMNKYSGPAGCSPLNIPKDPLKARMAKVRAARRSTK